MHKEPGPAATYTYTPIGTIHSPFTDIAGMPIQPVGARGVRGTIEIRDDLCEGLCDLAVFSRIILIYALHRCSGYSLTVTPFLDPVPHGIFATRSPKRPNAIGLSVVRLAGVDGCTITIEDVDVLDGTPLLDIKPYVPSFDAYPDSCCGWFESVAENAKETRSDNRFR
ncbi:MAG TPA: tRNA (N6-threonylcarbamoyladenosine(37)-N6)-methyltransferase TrmO [Methanoregula sp.]|nr:tRNA (N6-threonylcarbamoyladenosine(37)-N6)-methyltransferase TrmO [Methanoregula sp.]